MNRAGNVKTGKYLQAVIPAGLLFLAACASSRPARPVDPELSSLSRSGRAAFERGDYKLAARLYRMARQRAWLIDDPAEIGTVSYNLAAACLELGETAPAAELLREARRAFARGPGVPPDLLILQGRVALLRDRPAEAGEVIAEGLAGGEKDLEPEIRLQFRLLQARTKLAANDPETARNILEDLQKPVRKLENDLLQAEYASLSGELLFLQKDFTRAARLFDRAAELLFAAGRYRGMTRARERAGSAYWEAGESCPAGERFYRAARSRAARGETVAALGMIGSALAAVEDCPEENIREDVLALFFELERELGVTAPSGETE
ncbi:MAG: tetratricopeptide repeat protein [Candidatus Erginobacter occultus]|nr:tetratricopeptide repeat protein [Candidatus Erginobacter occultus]